METIAADTYWPIGDIISGVHHVSVSAELLPYMLGACIVLNCPLISHDILASMFAKFQSRICADGGSNVIYDTFPSIQLEPSLSPYMPDAIVGDLDSLRPEVRSFFEGNGVSVHNIPDQDSTDLDKALQFYAESRSDSTLRFVAIIGTIGAYEGRIDQFFAVINSMYSYRARSMRLMSIGNESVLLVLDTGCHKIQVPISSIGLHCGIVPMFGKVAYLTTGGFEWNLTGQSSEFGVLVSTNNIIREETVTIITSSPVLFTFVYRA